MATMYNALVLTNSCTQLLNQGILSFLIMPGKNFSASYAASLTDYTAQYLFLCFKTSLVLALNSSIETLQNLLCILETSVSMKKFKTMSEFLKQEPRI